MSESNRFDWKRFWYPFGTTVSFADDGFVADPEGEYGSYLNPELSGLTRYEDKQCLVLLGEPGLGKSDALDQYRIQLLETLHGSPDRVELINLKNFGSDFALVRNVFESNPIVSWVAGKGQLFLLFDSLDEGMLRVEALSGLLIQEFRKLPVERLWVCIACRPAVWPSSFGDDLRLLWGAERVSVLKLAPLRRRDVRIGGIGIRFRQFCRRDHKARISAVRDQAVHASCPHQRLSRDKYAPRGPTGNLSSALPRGCNGNEPEQIGERGHRTFHCRRTASSVAPSRRFFGVFEQDPHPNRLAP